MAGADANPRLTTHQRIFIVKTFYKTENKSETCRLFKREFQRTVKRDTVADIIQKFEDTGSTEDIKRSGRRSSICTDKNKCVVKNAFTQSPTKSTRRASQELGISRRSIQRMLYQLEMKPYHPHLVQALNDDDPDRRVEFCTTLLNRLNDDTSFLDKICWTDEACFKINGHVNRHNSIYWASENPHIEIQHDVNVPGLTVWAGVCSNGLIGPFFFEGSVTGHNYTQMLQNEYLPAMNNLVDINETWLQQDGAPPHYSLEARNWLDMNFTHRWIGRRGKIEYPPRSPDLTPPDFFLWGVLKNRVYGNRPNSLQELRRYISDACSEITPELCRKVCRSVQKRAEKCLDVNGHHFEYLL